MFSVILDCLPAPKLFLVYVLCILAKEPISSISVGNLLFDGRRWSTLSALVMTRREVWCKSKKREMGEAGKNKKMPNNILIAALTNKQQR
jgi:hypothetical protein